tara:strand:+ start:1118 stop:1288 length:171 start_codon:yes stop_codon:yes gene_type:complete
MMKKGKGYPEHVKNTNKSFGDPIKDEAMGRRSMSSALNEYPEDTWKQPKPKGGKRN